MNMREFQQACARTWNENGPDPLQNAALGIAGEAGEVADLVKKIRHHGHDMDKDKLAKEIGDVLYYVAVMAIEIGMSLDQVAEANVAKLKMRYPDGFDPQGSRNRHE